MPLVPIPGAFDHPEWLFELKHDGFRALAYVEGHRCTLVSRRRHVYRQFAMLSEEIAHAVRAGSLDGRSSAWRPMVARCSIGCYPAATGRTSSRSMCGQSTARTCAIDRSLSGNAG